MPVSRACPAHHFFIEILKGNPLVVVIDLRNDHFFVTAGTGKRVIAKRKKDGFPPPVKRNHKPLILSGPGAVKNFIRLPVAGIQSVITDHFEVLFRDVLDQVRRWYSFIACHL